MSGHSTLRFSTIELYREDMKFSAAHFTIFNATERERLHGHNYHVHTYVTAVVNEEGITYDYSETRRRVLELCRSLNEYTLLPAHSPHLKITEEGDYYTVRYQSEKMLLLKSDTRLLPVQNTTSECLAEWFLAQLTQNPKDLDHKKIVKIKVAVSTTPGQCSVAKWKKC